MTQFIERNLIKYAWIASKCAVARKRKVGAIVHCEDESWPVFTGCNIEQDFCTSVHAEVAAIVCMLCGGYKRFTHMVIVCEIPQTFPCGGCMDWIMQFGGPDALIAITHQTDECQQLVWRRAETFMPIYPV